MELTIDGKKYELNFGIGFVHELDKIAGMKSNGVSMGMSLMLTLPAFEAFDPMALYNILYAGTHADNPRPSGKDIEGYLDSLTDVKIDKLFKDIGAELKKSAMVRYTSNRLAKQAK